MRFLPVAQQLNQLKGRHVSQQFRQLFIRLSNVDFHKTDGVRVICEVVTDLVSIVLLFLLIAVLAAVKHIVLQGVSKRSALNDSLAQFQETIFADSFLVS